MYTVGKGTGIGYRALAGIWHRHRISGMGCPVWDVRYGEARLTAGYAGGVMVKVWFRCGEARLTAGRTMSAPPPGHPPCPADRTRVWLRLGIGLRLRLEGGSGLGYNHTR